MSIKIESLKAVERLKHGTKNIINDVFSELINELTQNFHNLTQFVVIAADNLEKLIRDENTRSLKGFRDLHSSTFGNETIDEIFGLL